MSTLFDYCPTGLCDHHVECDSCLDQRRRDERMKEQEEYRLALRSKECPMCKGTGRVLKDVIHTIWGTF